MRCSVFVAFACLVAGVVGACPVRAQARITEAEFLTVLDAGRPADAALVDRLAEARGRRARAGVWTNPVVEFEREAPHDAAEETTWRLSWSPPFLDPRRGAEVDAARAGLEAATRDLEARRLEARASLRTAYADWALAAERSDVVRSHLDLVERLAGQMGSRARSGEESGLAARRLSLVALEVRAQAVHEESEAIRARAEALAWRPDLATRDSVARPDLPAVSDTVATPLQASLLARRFEVEEAETRLKAGGRVLQFPELSFGWRRIRDDFSEVEGPVFGLSWPLPLFDRGQGDRAEASTRLTAARARLELAQTRARVELPAARDVYARLRESALAALDAAGQADSVEQAATATFRLGESRLTDLLETLRSVLSARLAALDLYAAALEAHRGLELAAGRPLTSDGGTR